MPLLDHFRPPLRGPRHWEGFHHVWAANIAQHLNREVLPPGFFATLSFAVDFARLEVCEVRVYEELGGAQLRAAIELVSPANKDRPGSRRTFAAKCAGYLKQAVGLVLIDVVTERTANLHKELLDALEVTEADWQSPTELYAVAYRPVPVQKGSHVEGWPTALSLGQPLPTLPLWLNLDLCVPLELEETYLTTCSGLRLEGRSGREGMHVSIGGESGYDIVEYHWQAGRRSEVKALEERFDADMMDIYRRAKSEANYNLSRYFQMLSEHRGLETARILLHAQAVSEGYTALWERGRLDLTVEALIHDHPEFHPLFTEQEREIARRRLEEYKYPPVIDPVEPFIGAFSSDLTDWTGQHDKHLGQALRGRTPGKSQSGS
jgi:hypothetical protein